MQDRSGRLRYGLRILMYGRITMKRRGLFAFAAAGVIIGGAWPSPPRGARPRAAPRGAGPARPTAEGGAADRAARPESPPRCAAERKEGASLTGDAGDPPMGLVRQRQTAGVAGQFRRHRRH